MVPRWVEGGSFLFAEVLLGVAVVVVLWMLDAGLGVDAARRSSAPARATSRRSGGGACRPTSEALGARAGHGGVEVKETPQPPTWHAKCRRTVPGTGCVSQGSSKGLNTESNNPQRATATVLAWIIAGRHCREEHTVLPRFRALWRGKTPTSCLDCIALAWRGLVQSKLGELKVATMANPRSEAWELGIKG